MPKKIPVIFHNSSTFDDHIIINQLAQDFKGDFDCIGENVEIYTTFPAPIKKEVEEEDDNDKKTTI